MDDVEKGAIFAVMPSTIAIELLDEAFELVTKRADGKKGTIVDVDLKVAKLARDIRIKYTRRGTDKDKRLQLPDCIYIAVAIKYGCEALVTRDGENSRSHNLLNVSHLIEAEYGVKILGPTECVLQPAFNFADNMSEDAPEGSSDAGTPETDLLSPPIDGGSSPEGDGVQGRAEGTQETGRGT